MSPVLDINSFSFVCKMEHKVRVSAILEVAIEFMDVQVKMSKT